MRKMLHLTPALFMLAACGGGDSITSPNQPQQTCTRITVSSTAVSVQRDSSISVSYTSNCNSVVATSDHPDVFPSQSLPANGTLTIDNATVSMTITLTGKGDTPSNTLVAQVAVNVMQPAPILSISSVPDSAILNHGINIVLNTKNVQSCSYSTNWVKTGKEDPATIAQVFVDKAGICTPTFSPGSTMPDSVLHRQVQLTFCGAGYDGQTMACSTVAVRLAIPKLCVDSSTPTTVVAGVATIINTFGCDSSFTTTNGEDFRGTLFWNNGAGDPPPTLAEMPSAIGQFINPTTLKSQGYGVLPTGVKEEGFVRYFANDGRPEAPLGLPFKLVAP